MEILMEPISSIRSPVLRRMGEDNKIANQENQCRYTPKASAVSPIGVTSASVSPPPKEKSYNYGSCSSQNNNNDRSSSCQNIRRCSSGGSIGSINSSSTVSSSNSVTSIGSGTEITSSGSDTSIGAGGNSLSTHSNGSGNSSSNYYGNSNHGRTNGYYNRPHLRQNFNNYGHYSNGNNNYNGGGGGGGRQGNYHNNNAGNGGYNSNGYHQSNNQANGGYRRNYGNKRHYPYVGEYYSQQGQGGQQYNHNHNNHSYGMNSRSNVQHAQQHIQPISQQQRNHLPNGSTNPSQGNHYHSHNSQSSNKVLPPINMYPPPCWPPGIEIEPNFKTYQRPGSSPDSLIAPEKESLEDGSGSGVSVCPPPPPNQWMTEIPIPFDVKAPPPPLPLTSFPPPPVMFPPPWINPAPAPASDPPEQHFRFNESLPDGPPKVNMKPEDPLKDSRLKLASPTPRRAKSPNFNNSGRGDRDPSIKFSHPYFGQHWQNRIDPDELVEAFKFFEIKVDPELVAPKDSDYALLSQAIWNKFEANQQTTETFRKKMELWREVFDIIQVVIDEMDCKLNLELAMKYGFKREKIHLNYGLQIVGSTMSGFGSNTSDVDMCLLIQCPRIELLDMRFEAVDCLHALWTTLSNMPCYDKVEVIYAKVPILKFRDVARNLDVDLNCNNSVGIRNTHLLYCYSQQDWRVRPLVLLIKMWAQFQGINDAKNMTVSSYSFVLMVIHFLQYGVSPPVLPVLQQSYSEKHGYYADFVKIKSTMNDKKEPNYNNEQFQSKNVQTLGELLLDFLEYYSVKFDWSSHAVSVRTGSVVSIKSCMNNRAKKNDPHQWKYMCIEEPFEFTNTARSVYDRDAFDRIRGVFFASWQRLILTQDLEAIFSLIHYVEARQIGARLRNGIVLVYKKLKLMDGSTALTACEITAPENLHLIRGGPDLIVEEPTEAEAAEEMEVEPEEEMRVERRKSDSSPDPSDSEDSIRIFPEEEEYLCS